MSKVTLLVLCAGSSSRFGLSSKKQWLRVGNIPLWLFVTKKIASYYNFDKVIITSSKDELTYMKNFSDDYDFVLGGDTRQDSIKNALETIDSDYVMVTDVARCCVPKDVILDLISNKDKASCIVPTLNVSDTVTFKNETINRDDVKLIQTPQLSNTKILKKALSTTTLFTDDSSAIKNIGESVLYIKGSTQSNKLTFEDDLKANNCLEAPCKNFFTGFGIDIHAFEENKKMVLGGVEIESDFGFKAHSDGDVLIHSVIDALLGACGAGDIGEFFPDTDEAYKNIDSKILLQKIVNFVYSVGYEIVNVDFTILAQKPKISPYKYEIKKSMAHLLNVNMQFVNVKATTAEKLGFVGRSEGITVHSVATLKYFNWKE
ncbi:MAG: bifunctional 2-C-methyl-D-erythritol 4-phosphate cytidylyltransferase/2-C-methyl-D-erythritol 2,4-cyclodiphosphate synthase [Arcobacter sp.]|uniref:bifunctional 2-C-methyl-D-erythritol 4-phosphate cytidylyltransferase/2-C-methyl-D-erythritol 2,4-cyclodiphosphate synthase n=1 Tax=uncultured Arcobacter sp. TaxID=165434 RepID=UPI000CBB65E1|nr:bifunctional 2-C-methyl-D-erythritol 4-phosphate cytidylyltransferase/2-C-methyl-D-erythritol 2,4-cyclodiphosphate synthase [uncultured Arcobacter sp.]PLY10904.1 MAG: bifunctional 2-C-methyl-D-erythritol 4-phosphate cytidylyltransferase/2-C-methyl-D-erythritol 2,4-cyclodiphosphate synthase [Arcobacter sp.]